MNAKLKSKIANVARLSCTIIICLSTWLFATVAVFAEYYPSRPTTDELDDIVEQGAECVLGVNERCWATQYRTNPVEYYVTAPFTNTTGLYLDQNTMGIMATNIRSLVQYYVDPDTVYNGATNMKMLAVTSLWVSLEIGNLTNQFTCTPATGTNAATYGDCPWRIYVANLQERYEVLNALKMSKLIVPILSTTDCARRTGFGNEGYGDDYAGIAAAWSAASWTNGANPTFTYGIGGYLDFDGSSPNSMGRSRGKVTLKLSGISTQFVVDSYAIFLGLSTIRLGGLFCDTDIYGSIGYCFETGNGDPPVSYTTDVFGNSASPFPDWPTGTPTASHYSWEVNNFYLAIDWQFDYCTE